MSSSETLTPARGPGQFMTALRRASRYTSFYPLVGLIVVSIVMVFASDSFLSYGNITNILRQVSINALIAVG
ncbi:MAG: ABC transporter permease, partial [Janthinobacterium lividum]